MKSILALCLLAMLAPAVSAAPFEARCEQEMRPQFAVDVRQSDYRIIDNVSSKVLNNRATHAYSTSLMLGMTEIASRLEVAIDGPALIDRTNGRECLAPHISVQLQVQPVEVYIAREFPAHGCPYRTVLAHEMDHVAIYRTELPKVEVTIRRELARRFADRPLYAPVGQALDQLQDEVDSWLRPLVKAELARVERAQAALDSDEEVFRLSHACNGELALNLSAKM